MSFRLCHRNENYFCFHLIQILSTHTYTSKHWHIRLKMSGSLWSFFHSKCIYWKASKWIRRFWDEHFLIWKYYFCRRLSRRPFKITQFYPKVFITITADSQYNGYYFLQGLLMWPNNYCCNYTLTQIISVTINSFYT